MTEKDMPPDDESKKSEPEEPEHHKSRRHGYRGYPNNPDIGGGVHSGTGFAGVGSTDRGTGEPSFISDKTRESVEELGEEEDEKE